MTTNNSTNNWSPLTTAGDLFTYSSVPTRLAVGSNLQMVQADSSQSNGLSYQYPGPVPSPMLYMYNDFLSNNQAGDNQYSKANSGTGSSSTVNQTSVTDGTHLGIMELSTGTTNTGYAYVDSQQNNIYAGSNSLIFETNIYLSALSNSTDRYIVSVGFGDNPGSVPSSNSNVIQITYTDNVNSGNWVMNVLKNGGTLFAANGSTGPSATTFYRLKFVTNGTTSVTGYVNDVAIGTVTQALPISNMFFVTQIVKTAGTTSVTMKVDYVAYRCIFTTPR